MTELLERDAFSWTGISQKAFDQLKRAMTRSPILKLLDFSKVYSIQTDALGKGMGAILQINILLLFIARNNVLPM